MPDQYRPEQFLNDVHRAICLGIDCNAPVDRPKEGKFPFLKNVRSYQLGRIEPRFGQTLAATLKATTSHIVSMRRLNNGSYYQHYVATLTGSLQRGQFSTAVPPTLTEITTGFSGYPVTMIPARSMDGAKSWMYCFDASQNLKVSYDGSTHSSHGIGYSAPTEVPTITPGVPFSKIFNDSEDDGKWSESGITALTEGEMYAGPPTIGWIAYDSGTSGWCTIVPSASLSGMLPGMHIRVNEGGGSVEDEIIWEVHPAISATAITSVVYEDAHWCVVQLRESHENLTQNCVIYNSTRTEHVRVQSVIPAADGTKAIRVYTGAANWAATDTITGEMSFRIYFNNTHLFGETLAAQYVGGTISTAGDAYGLFNYGSTFDMSTIEVGATGRASSDDDYLYCAIWLDHPEYLDEGKVMIDAGDSGFDDNYYYAVFKPSDLINSITGATLTIDDLNKQAKSDATQENVVSTETVTGETAPLPDEAPESKSGITRTTTTTIPNTRDYAGGTSTSEGGLDRTGIDPTKIPSVPKAGIANRGLAWWIQDVSTGSSQWTMLRLRLKDFTRVGNDLTKGWKNAQYIKLSFKTNTNSLAVRISTICIAGGFGLDVGSTGVPYLYRYRVRCSSTGARSNFSPVSRYAVSGMRDYAVISMSAYTADTSADYIDIERYGGNNAQWNYVGSVPNSGSPSFTDPFSDQTISSSPSEGNTHYQPWPVVSTKVANAGTATVAGTLISDSANLFKLNWAPGTIIHVEGIPCAIYKVHSKSLLELVESAGKQASGTSKYWVVEAPLLLAHDDVTDYTKNHLPVAFGPFEGHIFGVGDTLNPGTLYWTNQYAPDSAADTSRLEVTSASEPLMNGCVYNGRCYLWSSERMFQILPAFESLDYWRIQEIPGGIGLRTVWGISSFNQMEGPLVWFLGRDGIYQTDGGAPENVTNEDLMPLFPNEGNPGTSQTVDSNTLPAPYYADTTWHRYNHLCYHDGYLYYDYIDSGGTMRTLIYQPELKCWWFDIYGVTSNTHYGEEGSGVHNLYLGSCETTSHIYHYSGTADGGSAIACTIITPAYDQGAPRNRKMYGDTWLDYLTGDANLQTLTFKVLTGNFATSQGSNTVSSSLNRTNASYSLGSGASAEGLNIGHVISWSSSAYTPKIYQWGESYFVHPTDSGIRYTEFDNGGSEDNKWVQGILIEADTYNVAKTITVLDETGTVKATLTVQHNGRIIKPYSWPGFFSHMMRLAPTDSNDWQLFNWEWKFEPAPELTTTWESPDTTHELEGFQHLRDGYIAHISSADLTLTVTIDGTAYTYTIANGAGAYKKTYLTFQPIKGKYFRYKLTSASGFRLYQQDSELRCKIWGGQTQYHRIKPFGGRSLEMGARI